MEDKYYIPTIEEFHVGFEFESHWISGSMVATNKPESGWSKEIFDWQWSDTINDDWEHENEDFKLRYRVKILDQEDIESLGFKQVDEEITYHNLGSFNLFFFYTKPVISIDRRFTSTNGGYTDKQVFRGTIKNKSELKILMKQLGINK